MTANESFQGTITGDEGQRVKAEGECLIREHFDVEEDLTGFERLIHPETLSREYRSPTRNRGYVFVGPSLGGNTVLESNKDHAQRMRQIEREYQQAGKKITGDFVNDEQELAGFSWSISR